MPTVTIWVRPGSASITPQCAADWRDRLTAAGAVVYGPSTTPPLTPASYLVVLLTDNPSEPDQQSQDDAAVQAMAGRIVPVSLGLRASSRFGDLSQVIVGNEDPQAIAQRIVDMAEVGGERLVAFGNLMSAAHQWDREGRSGSQSLSRLKLTQAELLLIHPSLTSTPASGLVSQFLAASKLHHRAVRIAVSAVVAIVAAALVITSGGALLQGRDAAAATDASTRQANVSTSERLAGEAEKSMAGDPDMGWLLAQQALTAADTPQSRSAALDAMTELPRHRTFVLDGVPTGVASSSDGTHLVVAYLDGTLEFLDPNARVLRRVRLPSSVATYPSPSMSPDGSLVLVSGDKLTIVDAATGNAAAVALPAGPVGPIGWLTSHHAAVGTQRGVVLVDVAAHSATSKGTILASLGAIKALTVDAVHNRVIATGTTRYAVADAETGKVSAGGATASDLDVAFTSGGQSLVFVRGRDLARTVSLVKAKAEPIEIRLQGTSILRGPSELSAVSYGSQLCLQHDRGTTIRCFSAHQGTIAGTAWLSGSRLATVGGDQRLRIWEVKPVHYPLTSDLSPLHTFLPSLGNEEARHSMLTMDDASTLTLSRVEPQEGLVATINSATMLPARKPVPIIGLPVILRPTGQPGQVAFVTGDQAGVMDTVNRKIEWSIKDPRLKMVTIGLVTTAVNATRSAVAVGRGNGMVVFRRGKSNPPEFLVPAACAALWFGAADKARCLTVAGTIEGEDMASNDTTMKGSVKGAVSTALHVSDDELLVAVDGELQAWHRAGKVTPILQLPEGFEPYALRVSPQHSRIALIGSGDTIIIDRAGVIHNRFTAPLHGPEVEDVAFASERAGYLLRKDGSVEAFAALSLADLRAAVTTGAPRRMTDEERQAFHITTVSKQVR